MPSNWQRMYFLPPAVPAPRLSLTSAAAPAVRRRSWPWSRRSERGIEDASGALSENGKPRVIRADAEVTILGPDRMSIRLFRKGQGSNASSHAPVRSPLEIVRRGRRAQAAVRIWCKY